MKKVFVLNGLVIGQAVVFDSNATVSSGNSETVDITVEDDSPVTVGWRYEEVDGVLQFLPPASVYPKVGPIAFQMLFTPEEMITADGLKATDKVLASFWKLIDDPRTDVVDLGLESVQNAIAYTLQKIKDAGVDVDVPTRLAAILSGVLK